jgi:NRAMP (natural resistance-associated macrophage protein)-like metal ion transporter
MARGDRERPQPGGVVRLLGSGIIAGAADDDPSAIGTYAAAGAKLGPAFLWTAPLMFPMMFVVVYLSAKLGQVTGKGLFAVLRDHSPRPVLYFTLVGVLIGNTFEAAADLGGIAAALHLLVPWPSELLVVAVASAVLALQVWGSYELIRSVFRWLALVLLAYVASAIFARPDMKAVLIGTFVPTIRWDRDFLALLVAIIGTSLSAYLYTWQSNQEVEEEIAQGRTRLRDRIGATEEELRRSRREILVGMIFSNVIMYAVMVSTGATLFKAGTTEIQTAADAARALEPIAGKAAGALFAAGIIGVGFLAVPVMTAGAAYDLAQTFDWPSSLGARPHQAVKFYVAMVVITAVAVALNFVGWNPMRMLVWSGIVQGFSTPALMLLILLLTRDATLMGERANGTVINALGWITTVTIASATIALLLTWIL